MDGYASSDLGTLSAEVQIFVSETGMSQTRLGKEAAGDQSIFARIHAGRDLNSATIEKIRAYMAKERARIAGEAAEAAVRGGGHG